MNRKSIALWHVYVNGEWLAVEYDGYAPVSVEVEGESLPVMYRHMALTCKRDGCSDLLVCG